MKKSVRFEHGIEDAAHDQPSRSSKKRKQHDSDHDHDVDIDDHHNKRTKNAWAAEDDTDDMDSDESYTPPANFSLTPASSPTIYHADHFVDDSKELWLMRVPEHIPSQALDGLKLKISTSHGSTRPVATLDYEQYKFSVRESGSGSGIADEMSQLSCLLEQPSTASRLVPAPYPFARFFSVTETVDLPTPPSSS